MVAEIGRAFAEGVAMIVCVPARYRDAWNEIRRRARRPIAREAGGDRAWWRAVERAAARSRRTATTSHRPDLLVTAAKTAEFVKTGRLPPDAYGGNACEFKVLTAIQSCTRNSGKFAHNSGISTARRTSINNG
jgi:hypothetical protein